MLFDCGSGFQYSGSDFLERTMTKRLTVYLAGGLFDLRQLAGNAQLARAIETVSEGRYGVYLPQDYEPDSLDAKSIRDGDFEGLLSCEAAVFQFDGTELDSGTVAEFMAAKFADIPAVLLRTDFRRGGDRNAEPWNLMCSFYPRTESIVVDGMGQYVGVGKSEGCGEANPFLEVAGLVVVALDRVVATEAVVVSPDLDRKEQLKELLGIEK